MQPRWSKLGVAPWRRSRMAGAQHAPSRSAMYRACWETGAIAAPAAPPRRAPRRSKRCSASRSPAAYLSSDGDLERRNGSDSSVPARRTSAVAGRHRRGPAHLWLGRPAQGRHAHPPGARYKARIDGSSTRSRPSRCSIDAAPLAHVSGLLNGILVPAAAGMRTVLMARWNPEDALELIETEARHVHGRTADLLHRPRAGRRVSVRRGSTRYGSCRWVAPGSHRRSWSGHRRSSAPR